LHKQNILVKIKNISLPKHALILAPMEDVTDNIFRSLCKSHGADLLYSEFIASDAIIRNVQKSLDKAVFNECERPLGLQIFGNSPEIMAEAANILQGFNPDFIDLNFGCPVKKVVSKGGGAALLNDLPRMLAITKAVSERVKIPVTVKTRLGWDEKNKPIVRLAEELQDAGASAIAIHGRTRSQMYGGKADWTLIGDVKNNTRMHIPVFGNGDILTPLDAKLAFNTYGVDGVMIGRGAIGNPWLFKNIKADLTKTNVAHIPTLKERILFCADFLEQSIEKYGTYHGVLFLRKHYTPIFKGLPFFKNYRVRLLTSICPNEIKDIFTEIKTTYFAG